ncbi:MAG: alanine--tRNA ligase [Candidatus Woesearchaeota archaeon]
MLTDKEQKKLFLKETTKEPDKYYPTQVLKNKGFSRKQCKTCKKFFWSIQDRTVCGDASCQGGFTFLNNKSNNPLSYIKVWKEFEKLFKSFKYKSISRYPVVARWNPTTEFTIASIAAFQPFVVSGESQPPAEKLVIPQFCLRFGDLANVGVTMSHMTGFVMIGQHQFISKDKWNQEQAFEEIYSWITEGLKLKPEEVIFHEDAWAGGGNFGPCMEFFSSGIELGNQVYMMYEQTETEPKELSMKILDMGMGMERNAWFSQQTPTIYDATFPQVIEKLIKQTNVKYDKEFMLKYVPYGAYLNLDEVDNIHEAWEKVAKQMNVSVEVLKEKLEPMTAIYSIAEHTRSLLFAISDGMLPSNVGGGYNLRTIIRRALNFIEEFNWNVDLYEVCKWHAEELQPIFPELIINVKDIEKILESEKIKFIEGKKRNKQIIETEIQRGVPSTERLIQLYDTKGITPEEIAKVLKSKGEELEIPENFYSLISDYHEKKEKVQTGTNHDKLMQTIDNLPPTEIMYYNDWNVKEFTAKVLKIEKNIFVLLDKTAFYPTSGGQMHDAGTMNGKKLLECVKQGKHVIHIIEGINFKEGDIVTCEIDYERRKQLSQHHTATHIINGVAKKILGNHIWQAGASKSIKKARLDITHFDNLTNEQLKLIEEEANKIIKEGRPITKTILPRAEAEKKYGFKLYQGGAVPGSEIRVVEIQDLDVEACGGTHLNNTSEAVEIKVLKSSKVQDGTIRIEFVAGKAASKEDDVDSELVKQACVLLRCEPKELPYRAEELFEKWKKAKKGILKKSEFEIVSRKKFEGDVLIETASILKTQPEHIVNTITKFLTQYGSLKRIAK